LFRWWKSVGPEEKESDIVGEVSSGEELWSRADWLPNRQIVDLLWLVTSLESQRVFRGENGMGSFLW
jgi:hypothetical protein